MKAKTSAHGADLGALKREQLRAEIGKLGSTIFRIEEDVYSELAARLREEAMPALVRLRGELQRLPVAAMRKFNEMIDAIEEEARNERRKL